MRLPTPPVKLRLLLPALALAGAIGLYGWFAQVHPTAGSLILQGNVEIRQVNLGFKVAGRIAQLAVDEGDRVQEGQVLGTLEKVYFEDTLAQMRAQRDQMAANLEKMETGNRPEDIAQARANVAEREATLTNAQVALDRAQELLKSVAGLRKNYDDALAAKREAEARLAASRQFLRLMESGYRKEDIELARAQLAERVATVRSAERQLADTDLIAPSPGTVLSRVREVGAIVAAGESVYVLSLTSPVWVRSYVSEPELGRIHPGMEVAIQTDTPGGKIFTGHIGFISPTAEFTPKPVETRELRTALVYRLRIVVEDASGALRQGMPVTISVSTSTTAAS
jgi:HlyD family secretion protein